MFDLVFPCLFLDYDHIWWMSAYHHHRPFAIKVSDRYINWSLLKCSFCFPVPLCVRAHKKYFWMDFIRIVLKNWYLRRCFIKLVVNEKRNFYWKLSYFVVDILIFCLIFFFNQSILLPLTLYLLVNLTSAKHYG